MRWNEYAVQAFGYTADEAIGNNINIIMPDDIASHHDKYVQRYVRTGVAKIIGQAREVMAKTKDGKLIICQLKLNELKLSVCGIGHVQLVVSVEFSLFV